MADDLKQKILSNLEFQKQIFGEKYYSVSVNIPERTEDSITQELIEKDNQPVASAPAEIVSTPAKTEKAMSELTIDSKWIESKSLDLLHNSIHNCKECVLGETRNNFVFGSGNPNADIMIIGEAPGADEDMQGLPFVGRAGKLLTKIIEAIDLTREDVYIANIIKCRPPNNRRPKTEEVDKCEPYLKKQIELIDPKFILSLGKTSVDTLLKGNHVMKDIRGKFLEYEGRKLMVTYHPAALLRNPNWKRPVWEDVKKLRAEYDKLKN